MNTLLAWFNSPEWMIVVKTLLNTLWQAGGLALLLWIALRRATTPTARYRLTLGTLAAILGTTLLTWAVLNQSVPAPAAPDFASPTTPARKSYVASPAANFGEPSVIAYATPIAKPAEETRWSGWLALAWLLGSALMLTRAGIQVAGAERLRRSCKPLDDSRITQLLAEAQRALNLTRRIRVAVTDKLTSPAVVGVIVPTLILPLTLLTTLTPEQIRFILMHELAHIRRGDYFANLFQLFIEALLFFNPAVWWISHQVRREREACCDALAIELSGAPVDYARTLLHVAETVLNPPPAAAPAFSDNPREPSSLTDRVQRLLVPGYRPALRLTWRAMLAAIVVGGTLLFLSAVGARNVVGAVSTNSSEKATEPATNVVESTNIKTPERETKSKPEKKFTHGTFSTSIAYGYSDGWLAPSEGGVLYEIGTRGIIYGASLTPNPASSLYIKPAANRINLANYSNSHAPVVQLGTPSQPDKEPFYFYYRVGSVSAQPVANLTSEQKIIAEAEAYSRKISEATKPTPPSEETPRRWVHYRVSTNLMATAVKGRSAILEKLSKIRLENFACDQQPLKEVLLRLSSESRLNDPDKMGIYFAEIAEATPDKNLTELDSIPITIHPNQGKSSLWDVLTLLVKGAERPIEFYISDDAVMFMLESQNVLRSSNRPVQVYGKGFKADPNLLAQAFGLMPQSTGSPALPRDAFIASTNVSPTGQSIRKTLMRIGLDLNPAQGKTFYYKVQSGALYVRATLDDLDAIENFITANCILPPQVNIKIRWVEIPKRLVTSAWLKAASNAFLRPLTNPDVTLNILTEAQTADVLERIKRRENIFLLNESHVTTLTERQAQISVSEMKTVVTGINPKALTKPGVVSTNAGAPAYLETESIPLGPVFDVLPTLSANQATISLHMINTHMEFLGYNKAAKEIPIYVNGKKSKTTLPLPRYRVCQMTNDAVVPDGRTLILGNFPMTEIAKQPNGETLTTDVTSTQTNLLFILVTPTITDPAGNRINPAPKLKR